MAPAGNQDACRLLECPVEETGAGPREIHVSKRFLYGFFMKRQVFCYAARFCLDNFVNAK